MDEAIARFVVDVVLTPAFLTVIISAVVGVIAYAQMNVARIQAEIAREQKRIAAAKLNLELFEQRYAVFEAVWAFLTDAPNDLPENVQDPLRPAFTNLVPKARSLFGNEIAAYMYQANSYRL